ncbi:MAG: acyl-CoA dehydrogenase family protein [Hyphomicrobiales bacterium]|nr:acyl-CoA dehydrogenase family protein [Hyphomicrobiales bacterium]MCP5370296.1 acyl-CoA dehydrogenase family protein [Hyphomicrobiales bacterium]
MPDFDDPDLALLRDSARRLTDDVLRPSAARWDRDCEPPLENLPHLARAGLTGITVAEEYGGSGADVVYALTAIEELAKGCTATAAFVLTNCVSAEVLQAFGSAEQKRKYLPPLAAGEWVGAWAMTEPEAGSAATELRTRAVADGGDYVLNGSKVFITRAAIAAFFVAFARIGDEPGAKGVTAFVVDRGTPGLRIGAHDRHMGLRGGASAEVVFEDCRVPADSMLVAPGQFGQLMRGLNQARVLNPGMCLGIAGEALGLATRYAQTRRQFGREIGRFQGIQWMLADMACKVEAMRLLVYRAAGQIAAGHPDGPHNAAIAKAFAGENAFEVVDRAMQIHGGYGYSSELPLERMLRDVRAFKIGGGSTEIMRNRIAKGLFDRFPV